MHGVPADLKLPGLVGSDLETLMWAAYTLHLGFSCGLSFDVCGSLEFCASDGSVIERGVPEELRPLSRLGALVGAFVTDYVVDAPHALVLDFGEAGALRLRDDTDQYEAFQIEPLGIVV